MNRRQFLTAFSSAPLLAQTAAPGPEVEWVDAKKLTVEGLGFKDVKSPYDRLPGRAEGVVPPAVWNLSRDSAGVLVRFTAATTEIRARWTVTNKNLAGANITAIASSGLDLYARTDAGKWRWAGTGQPMFPDSTAALISGIPATEREFMVYLPLRNGVTSLEFGVPGGSTIKSGPPRARGSKPIVFYGTSITHGIGASRAGMTHVAMLGRSFNREVINLGFSGNGRMEPEVVKFVAELDPAVFVLDCLPNMTAQQVAERIVPGVKLCARLTPIRRFCWWRIATFRAAFWWKRAAGRMRPTMPHCANRLPRSKRKTWGRFTIWKAPTCWATTARVLWTAPTPRTWGSHGRPRSSSGYCGRS
jgi:hypothetical protein